MSELQNDSGKTETGQVREPGLQPGESSPPTYEITTVRDFLAVPEDRIAACLHDFAKFLRAAPKFAALLTHISDEMHGPGVVTFVAGERFTWVDDEAESMSLGVLMPNGERSDVLTITPDEADKISRSLERLAEDAAQRAPEGGAA